MFRYALLTILVVSAGIYLVLFLCANPVTTIFNKEHNPLLQEIAVYGLRLYFTSAAFVGFNIIMAIFFTSTEHMVPAHIISILRGLVLIIPMAFLLSAFWGMTGIWLSYPITELAVAAVGILLYMLNNPV